MAAGNALPTKKHLQSKWSSSKKPLLVRLASIIRARNAEELEHFLKQSKWDVDQMFPDDLAIDLNSFTCKCDTDMRKFCIYCRNSDESKDCWMSALHLVIDGYWCEGLDVLIKAGANINLCDYLEQADGDVCGYSEQADGFTTVLSPSFSPSVSPDLRAEWHMLFTPLMRAIWLWPRFKDLAFVKELLEHGADPNLRCPNTNFSAISMALVFRAQSVIDLILKKCKIDLPGMTLKQDGEETDILSIACGMMASTRNGIGEEVLQPKLIKDLVNHGADVNAHTYDLLSTLCPWYHDNQLDLEILDILFKAGIDINVIHEKRTILQKAYGKRGNTFRWLIKHGVNTDFFTSDNISIGSYAIKMFDHLFLLIQAGDIQKEDIMALRKMGFRAGTLHGLRLQTTWDESRRSTFLQWNSGRHMERKHQEADLLEFSDETLHTFPENSRLEMSESEKKLYLKQILDFISEPPSLKWRCRQSIRQNLLSHSPSVVKSFSLPSSLKRYILCHEL